MNNDCNTRLCDPIKLNVNDGHNNINGELVPDPKGNLMLNLNGSIGQSNLNLVGTLDHPNIVSPRDPASNQGGNNNVGKVNMNLSGNIGDVPLNFNGNLGNLNTGRNNNEQK